MGIRHGFGLFLQPISHDMGWGRETFALAIAVQNLVWGATQPFVGMISDKYGAARVVMAGAALYALGLVAMANSHSPLVFVLTSGVLLGVGLSGVTFSVISGVLGRRFPAGKAEHGARHLRRRGFVRPVRDAAGDAVAPRPRRLVRRAARHGRASRCCMAPMAAALVERRGAQQHAFIQSAGQAMREALGHRGYMLLTVGFFVCGFQVVFLAVHLPAYLADKGMPARVAVTALALIGLFNIVGTYIAGWLGGRMPKKYILSAIYFARAVVFALFFWVPISVVSVYAFAVALGFLWLSTVPVTNGVVAQIFGVRYLAMLSGFAFFSHQIGSFLGAWLGGKVYDLTGNYDIVWYLSIALALVAGFINLPIDEREIRRPALRTGLGRDPAARTRPRRSGRSRR